MNAADTLATHALAHLEKCFAEVLDKKITCPACGHRIVEEVSHHVTKFDDGVLVFSTCCKCAEKLKRGPIHKKASKRVMNYSPAVFIEADAAEEQFEAVDAWIKMEDEA